MVDGIVSIGKASTAGLLGDLTLELVLAFYTSSAVVRLSRETSGDESAVSRRWKIVDWNGISLGTSILLPSKYRGSKGDFAEGRVIIIQQAGSSRAPAYRLMLIKETTYGPSRLGISATVASRLGVS